MDRDKFTKRCKTWALITYVAYIVSGVITFASALCMTNGNKGAIWTTVIGVLITWLLSELCDALDRRANGKTG